MATPAAMKIGCGRGITPSHSMTVPNAMEVNITYRWDLVTPGQFGTLRPADAQPDLWFFDELVECTAKVVARSGGGDLYFVGRSLDSMYDLLCGAFEDTDHRDRVDRLPLSFALRATTVYGTTRAPDVHLFARASGPPRAG